MNKKMTDRLRVESKYLCGYTFGKQAVKLYGNPVTMSVRSPVIDNLKDEPVEFLPLMDIDSDCEQGLFNVWIYLNGMYEKSYPVATGNVIVHIHNWINYFNIDRGSDYVWFYLLQLSKSDDIKALQAIYDRECKQALAVINISDRLFLNRWKLIAMLVDKLKLKIDDVNINIGLLLVNENGLDMVRHYVTQYKNNRWYQALVDYYTQQLGSKDTVECHYTAKLLSLGHHVEETEFFKTNKHRIDKIFKVLQHNL